MSPNFNEIGKEEGNVTSERNNSKGEDRCDDILEEELLRRSKAVITASLIVDSLFGEENCSVGYCCVQSKLKGTHEILNN